MNFLAKVKTFTIQWLLVVCTYYSTIEVNVYVDNAFTFLTWLTTISMILLYGMRESESLAPTYEKLLQTYRDGKHLPKWMDILSYSLVIVLFASVGRYVMAMLWFIKTAMDLGRREEALKDISPNDSRE